MSAPTSRGAMAPLSELSDAALATLDGVVFDVDDTVTREGTLETEALGAMYALREAGLVSVAVTGRPVGWAEVFAATWPIALALGENGAGWAHLAREPGGGRHLLRGAFEPLVDLRPRIDALVATVRARYPDVRLASDQPLRRFDVAFDVGERATMPKERVELLRLTCEEAGARVIVSSVHLHAAFGAWDKAEGVVRAAASVLGKRRDEVRDRFLFVGDSGNDAPAFSFFSHTVGVANVREHLARLPVPPRFVTPSPRGVGFAEVAMRVAAARGKRAP